MSQIFQYKGRYYGSVPTLPIKIGASVLIVFKTVGMVRYGMRYLKCIGEVTHIFYPHSHEHEWWSICHVPDYVVPKPTDIILKVAFGKGISEIFLPHDLVHVVWLPTDNVPTLDEADIFNL